MPASWRSDFLILYGNPPRKPLQSRDHERTSPDNGPFLRHHFFAYFFESVSSRGTQQKKSFREKNIVSLNSRGKTCQKWRSAEHAKKLESKLKSIRAKLYIFFSKTSICCVPLEDTLPRKYAKKWSTKGANKTILSGETLLSVKGLRVHATPAAYPSAEAVFALGTTVEIDE